MRKGRNNVRRIAQWATYTNNGEIKMDEDSKTRVETNSASLVLDLANSQYAVQWNKIGNLQTSASSVLTLISLVAAIVLGVVTSKNTPAFIDEISYQGIAFYISIIMSIVYMILACVFMYMILRTKYVKGLRTPTEVHKEIIEALTEVNQTYTEGQQLLYTTTLLLEKINDEIINTDEVLKKNRFWYSKCLNSSFFSLSGSILSLLFVNGDMFKNNNFYISVLSILSYLLLISVFIIIFFLRRDK